MTLGGKLKSLRKEKGINQAELAAYLGVTMRTIQNYESGSVHPKNYDVYYRLADYFNVDPNYLLTDSEEVLIDAQEKGGRRAAVDVAQLIDGVCGLFSGGFLPEEDMDAAMRAISDAYFSVKEENKKYAPKNKK